MSAGRTATSGVAGSETKGPGTATGPTRGAKSDGNR
jgi:hypothetical protein